MVSMNDHTYAIKISFVEDVQENSVLHIFVTKTVVSQENSLLITSEFEAVLYPETNQFLAQQSLNQQIAAVQSATQQGAVVFGVTLLSGSLLNLNLAFFFQFLNAAEVYLWIQFFCLDLDPVFLAFMADLQSSVQVPSIFTFIVDKTDGNYIPQKYQTIGFDTTLFMINSGPNLTLLIGLVFGILAIFGSKLVFQVTFKKNLKKIKKSLIFRVAFRYWLQSVFDISINCIIGVYLNRLQNNSQKLDLVLCIIAMVINKQLFQALFFWSLIKLISKRMKIKECEEEVFLSNFGTFFEEFRYAGLSSCLFYVIFVMRRYAMVASVLFFANPMFKIFVAAIFSMIVRATQVSLYLFLVHPMKNKINQVYVVLNEALTVSYYSYVGLQYLNLIEYNKSTQGSNCIKMIVVALAMNGVFGMLSGVYNVISYFINRRKQRNSAIKTEVGTLEFVNTEYSSNKMIFHVINKK